MVYFFFFNDTATTEIYTLSLHDALPIYADARSYFKEDTGKLLVGWFEPRAKRSEEHTSELQSQSNLVCRLLLEKKKKTPPTPPPPPNPPHHPALPDPTSHIPSTLAPAHP